ncbi:long-chain fatty acid transport protein [Paraperlucidibaca baekdonensis]|uniref:Long-chain fatty acid transport protein n=1 Tax=Paraperlucidibaca baekdonensis TaxID=748120 RepID=A0A3E0H8M3_9GAMM|nr:outer membrane protein transport protein [Paraperlucidibaca baekdonensis]REH39974.1 long-chain fatty acid transport protein [Paraperlucidibaca baekdonensis]
MKRLLAVVILSVSSNAAFATNGYFAHGYSASQRAQGGAGTATSDDALIATINPAGIGRLKSLRWDANLSLFVPRREFEATAPDATGLGIFATDAGRVKSSHNLFAIPGFAIAGPINDTLSAGLAVYGNGGLNTVYKQGETNATFFGVNTAQPGNTGLVGNLLNGLGVNPGNLVGGVVSSRCQGAFGGGDALANNPDLLGFCGNGNGTASVDLIQLFVTPTLAINVSERLSFGLSPIFAVQRFEAKGLSAFAPFSNAPGKVTDNGTSFSYGGGGRIGMLATIAPGLDFGASWQSRIHMTKFKEYAGLFPEQGDFDIPSAWNLGLAWQPHPQHRFLLDYQHISFNEVASVGRPLNPQAFVSQCALPRLAGKVTGLSSPSPSCLGADTGPGFGWQDMDIYKFGYQYSQGDWTWRAGYSQPNSQPIPSSEVTLNILAPGVVEQHYTLGVNWQASPRWGFDLSMMYADADPVRGRNPLSNVQLLNGNLVTAGIDSGDQEIALDMRQYEVTFGMNYTY